MTSARFMCVFLLLCATSDAALAQWVRPPVIRHPDGRQPAVRLPGVHGSQAIIGLIFGLVMIAFGISMMVKVTFAFFAPREERPRRVIEWAGGLVFFLFLLIAVAFGGMLSAELLANMETAVGVVVIGVTAVTMLGIVAILAWMDRTIATLRIISIPDGPAPEHIRRAWIGLEIPLYSGEADAQQHEGLKDIAGNESLSPVMGYAIDGGRVVELLAKRAPDAAAWWRENAPQVLQSGYRLVFKCDNCELIKRGQKTTLGRRS